MMNEILCVAKKEYKSFFSSPAAYLFLGAFIGSSLFVFFWVETFFVRNIADIRPLFQWFPLLLIFLVASLTMRSWSEEKRSGTVEALITSPVGNEKIIIGKFIAALKLVSLAMVLTAPIPITVSLLGPIDWGPVIGGYIATFFLAAAYIAIGLFTSGRTDNPIVALILTTLVCGFFYILGSPIITGLLGNEIAAIFNLLGTGARFESITRGVIDSRDLIYYLSIVFIFLTLNFYSLESSRWPKDGNSEKHRGWRIFCLLAIINAFLINLWLSPINNFRLDLTQGSLYSLSKTTKSQIKELKEPLLIRAYFSERSHPLLSPLVPQLKDLLKEYQVAGKGNITLELIDPQRNSELEEEAASKYGVRPVPFQTASRHQAEVVNSYFDIVIAYGDQFEKLSYAALIEAKASSTEAGVDVRLKNPEYSITRAIKKTTASFRAEGSPLDSVKEPVFLKMYISETESLPKELVPVFNELKNIALDYKKDYKESFNFAVLDPEKDQDLAVKLNDAYGVKAQVASILDPKPFWFSIFVESGENVEKVQFGESLDKESLKRSINSALKRLAPGYLRTVALVTPSNRNQNFTRLKQVLSENLKVAETDLEEGEVPEDADMLLLLAPNKTNDMQLRAIDQFLMRGGSVVLATSPFNVTVGQSIDAKAYNSGVEDWLSKLGFEIEPEMVLDPKSASLPIPVQRFIGGIPVREIQLLPYPHFPDIRGTGINQTHPITSALNQMTLNWSSPIIVDGELTENNNVVSLLESSRSSWTSDNLNVVPDYENYPDTGFSDVSERNAEVLAVAASGPFESYFSNSEEMKNDEVSLESLVLKSPKSSRLVLIASNSFGADGSIDLASYALNTLYTKPLEFVQNAVDWSTEDESLLNLRGKSQFARTLEPMVDQSQQLWEIANYILALLGLGIIWLLRRRSLRLDQLRYTKLLSKV